MRTTTQETTDFDKTSTELAEILKSAPTKTMTPEEFSKAMIEQLKEAKKLCNDAAVKLLDKDKDYKELAMLTGEADITIQFANLSNTLKDAFTDEYKQKRVLSILNKLKDIFIQTIKNPEIFNKESELTSSPLEKKSELRLA